MKNTFHILFGAALVAAQLSACGPLPAGTEPSTTPTAAPTQVPSAAPTAAPTPAPTTAPTNPPSSTPSAAPTSAPTDAPSTAPTAEPTAEPSPAPSASSSPAPNSNVPTPRELEVVLRNTNSVVVQWEFPDISTPSSYTLYRDGQEVASNITVKQYTFGNLSPSTQYQFEVATVTDAGASNRVSVIGLTTSQGSSGSGNFSGGGSGNSSGNNNNATGATPTPTPTPTVFMQMERLARPAINEGLIISNNLLNTWNMVPPSADLTAAAQPIANEATTVLMALGNDQNQVNALFTALLPDVMRIDTTIASGYTAGNTTAQLRPIGGRLIEDDTIDLTLALVVPGGAPGGAPIANIETDNVEYNDTHAAVQANFPFLAAPN